METWYKLLWISVWGSVVVVYCILVYSTNANLILMCTPFEQRKKTSTTSLSHLYLVSTIISASICTGFPVASKLSIYSTDLSYISFCVSDGSWEYAWAVVGAAKILLVRSSPFLIGVGCACWVINYTGASISSEVLGRKQYNERNPHVKRADEGPQCLDQGETHSFG